MTPTPRADHAVVPCPFCGGEPRIIECANGSDEADDIVCTHCGAYGPTRKSQWNSRVDERCAVFDDLFNGSNFTVQIGGNPILVERMLDRIDAACHRLAAAPKPAMAGAVEVREAVKRELVEFISGFEKPAYSLERRLEMAEHMTSLILALTAEGRAVSEPSDEQVECAARAIYEEDDPWHKAWHWPNLNPEAQGGEGAVERYRAIARAALLAALSTPEER